FLFSSPSFPLYGYHRDLPSFPTRRSSDLSLNSFTFQAIPDEEVDLTLVKPVPGVSPAGTIRGPRGTSLESIEVDDSHLIFTAVNEAGDLEMARIPISHVVEAEAREAARQAAENVAEITTSNLEA